MTFRSLTLAAVLLASPALAGSLDRKSPPPMKPIISCLKLKIQGDIVCVPVEQRVIREFGLQSGDRVTPRKMFEIKDEEQAFRARQLR